MSTYENRVEALERKVESLEQRRLQDQQNAEQNIPLRLRRSLREINENATFLIGLIIKQSERIAAIEESLDTSSVRVGYIDNRLDDIDRRLEDVDKRFNGVGQRLDGMDQSLNEIKGALAQILARLPEKSS